MCFMRHCCIIKYYEASACRWIQGISIPTLCLNAEDDPVCSSLGAPTDAVQDNDKLIFCVTRHGGHVAWLEGLSPSKALGTSWADRACVRFIEALEAERA